MSGLLRAPFSLLAALRSAGRWLALAALGGLLAGAVWGSSERPEYLAVATVIVSDRGEPAEIAGNGFLGTDEDAGNADLLETARGDLVATTAAAVLGADVPGADLVALTSFRLAGNGNLIVRSTAPFPDFASATANAFALAIETEVNRSERKRLETAQEDLEAELAERDPLVDETEELQSRLDAVIELDAAGPPLRVGKEAELPTEPLTERSALSWSLGLGAAALLAAILAVCLREAILRPVRRPEQVESATDLTCLGRLSSISEDVVAVRPGVIGVRGTAPDELLGLARELGFGARGQGPQTLAIASAVPSEMRTPLAIGIAVAAAGLGESVILVETDLKRPELADHLRVPVNAGLNEYLLGEATPREVMRTIPIAAEAPGETVPSFVAVPGAAADRPAAELLAGERFRGLVQRLRRVYDVVIFTSAPVLLSADAVAVAEVVEATVLCVGAGADRARDIAASERQLRGANLIGHVFTGAPRGGLGSIRLRG